ncbi:MAG: aryl-sulfate sulfotransferase [Myxococcota bacterium]
MTHGLLAFSTAVTLVGTMVGCGSPLTPEEAPADAPLAEQVAIDGLTADPRQLAVDQTPGGGTTETGTSAALSASCELTDNALRAICTVSTDPPGPVRVTFAPVDGSRPARTHDSISFSATHRVPLYFLTPDTAYEALVTRADGGAKAATAQFDTELPPGRYSTMTVDGTSSSPMMGMSSPCSASPVAVVHDTNGDLLWIQHMAMTESARMEGVSFTEDQTVLAVLYQGAELTTLSEVNLEGDQLMWFQQGVDFDERVHHDAFRKNGLTYALAHEVLVVENKQVLLDGVYVFDSKGLVAEWWLSDDWIPPASAIPGGIGNAFDLTHANAVWVDDVGDIYVSFRHISSIAKITGLGANFGTLQWVIAGSNTPWRNDFGFSDLPDERSGFIRQHNIHQLATGSFAIFDNRSSPSEPSRLLVFDLNQPMLEFTALEAYDLPVHCPFQGGAWFTGATNGVGNPVATCAPERRAYEYELGSTGVGTAAAPVLWEAQLSCTGAGNTYVPRFVPLDW